MSDRFIMILDTDLKLQVSEMNPYEDIDDYYWISRTIFNFEEEAYDCAIEILHRLPIPFAMESQEIYLRRYRRAVNFVNLE